MIGRIFGPIGSGDNAASESVSLLIDAPGRGCSLGARDCPRIHVFAADESPI